jgi:hypothetical protein
MVHGTTLLYAASHKSLRGFLLTSSTIIIIVARRE